MISNMEKDKAFIKSLMETAEQNGYTIEVASVRGGKRKHGAPSEAPGMAFELTVRLDYAGDWDETKFEAMGQLVEIYAHSDNRFSNKGREPRVIGGTH